MAVLLKLSVLFPILLCCVVECSKILMVQPSPFNADNILGFKLAEGLLKRGHKIVMISPFTIPEEIRQPYSENYREVAISRMPELVEEMLEHRSRNEDVWLSPDKASEVMKETLDSITESLFKELSVHLLMNSNAKYDLIILTYASNYVHIGLSQHFKAPLILLESNVPSVLNKVLLGNPLAIPHLPAHLGTEYTSPMNFWQRLDNLFEFVMASRALDSSILPKHREMFKKYYETDLQLDDVLYNNVSLMLTNSHFAVTGVTPLLPAIVEIGGFHIEPHPKNISSTFQEIFDNAKNGVVIYSTDSKSEYLKVVKPAIRDVIMQAFGSLAYVFLWDSSYDMPNNPDNVFVKDLSHFHREELLAHPKVLALISDGSLLTTLEAIHHGIPILGLPLVYDDRVNIATAVTNGYALLIPLKEVTADKLSTSLTSLINDPKYRREAQRRSRIMRHRPMRPLHNAIFWIEHVIQFKGAAHLRSHGSNFNWFQREMFDLYIFCTILTILLAVLLLTLIGCLIRGCIRDRRRRREKRMRERAMREGRREELLQRYSAPPRIETTIRRRQAR